MFFFVPSLIAFLLVIFLTYPLRKLARLSGIVDKPGGRKKHVKAIPPIGGIIIFSVFLFLGVVSDVVDLHKYWALYVGLIILLMSGALDDQFYLPAIWKLFVQLIAAAVIVFGGDVQAAYLGDLFGQGVVWTGFMSYPFTILAIVLLINAMNLMDGMDGLVGGVCAVFFAFFMLAAFRGGWSGGAQVLSLLLGVILGFLVFNMRNHWRRSACLFLGDAGSTSLGLVIAWFAVHLARGPEAPLEPVVVAWIIGFPIFDTCAQFYRRIREGRDPFSPDRGHFHHHFIKAGIPVHYASFLIISVVAGMGMIGYVSFYVFNIPQWPLTLGWIMLLLTHIALSYKTDFYVVVIKHVFSAFIERD